MSSRVARGHADPSAAIVLLVRPPRLVVVGRARAAAAADAAILWARGLGRSGISSPEAVRVNSNRTAGDRCVVARLAGSHVDAFRKRSVSLITFSLSPPPFILHLTGVMDKYVVGNWFQDKPTGGFTDSCQYSQGVDLGVDQPSSPGYMRESAAVNVPRR